MSQPPALHDLDRVLRRLRRTAEANRERADRILSRELEPILSRLLAAEEEHAALAADGLFVVLGFLAVWLEEFDDDRGDAASFVPRVCERLQTILLLDLQHGGTDLDAPHLLHRLLAAWSEDGHGHLAGLESIFVQLAEETLYGPILESELRRMVAELPLVFERESDEDLDPRRLALKLQRRGLERLRGELMAVRGQHDLAIAIAEEHFGDTGDAVELVRVLERAGRYEVAARIAGRALESGRTTRRSALETLLERCLSQVVVEPDRGDQRRLERAFLQQPNRTRFETLRCAVDAANWPHVRGRMLAHLQRHRREPDLVFRLWLEEGELLEADGLVVTQPVAPEDLDAGARRIEESHPAMAAGWLLIALERRVARGEPLGAEMRQEIERLSALARATDQLEALEDAFDRLVSRRADDAEFARTISQIRSGGERG